MRCKSHNPLLIAQGEENVSCVNWGLVGGTCELKRKKDGICGLAEVTGQMRRGILAEEQVWYGTASQESVLFLMLVEMSDSYMRMYRDIDEEKLTVL